MAITAEELRILVRAETKGAVENLNRFKKSTKTTTVSLKDLAKSLIGPLSVTVGIVALSRAAFGAIRSSVAYAASVEQISVAFEVLLGSAEDAQIILEELRQFSVKTPFTFEELAPAAKRLLAFGTAAEDVVSTMRDLGNAAAGNGETLNRLVDAFGKVQAKGRASLEELNRFTEAGVPLMRQLAEDLELTNEELFKFVSQGKVGFKEVNTALQNLTRDEGQFAGLLEKQSETLTGVLSTAKGAIQELGRAFTEDLLPFLTEAVNKLVALTEAILAQRDANRELGESLKLVEGLEGLEGSELVAAATANLAIAKQDLKNLNEEIATTRDGLLQGILIGVRKLLQADIAELEAIVGRVGISFGDLGGEGVGGGLLPDENDGKDAAKEVINGLIIGLRDFLSPDMLEEFNSRFFDPIVNRAFEAGKDAGKDFSGSFKEAFAKGTVEGGPLIPDFNILLFGPDKGKSAFANIKANVPKLSEVLGFPTTGEVEFDPIVRGFDEAAAAANKFWESVGGSAAQQLGSAGIQLLSDLGAAASDSSEGAKTAKEAMDDFKLSIAAALPQLLFSAAIQAFTSGLWEIGLGLLAASGLAALIGGAVSGNINEDRAAAAASTDLPDPELFTARSGSAFAGDTITIIQGDAFVADARDERTVATINSASGNR